ncbi:MAG: hypothetical protein ACKO63_10435 [Nodosilinea sp.]
MVIHAFSNPGAAIKLLLVNSNSTQAVSDRMVAVARTVAAPQTIITGITAPGHKVIRSHFVMIHSPPPRLNRYNP